MLYIFNPDHDLAIADFSPNYTPPASIVKMREDLAVLPLWFTNDSKVIADGEDNLCFYENIKRIIPVSSTIITTNEIVNCLGKKIVPWGWNPLIRNKMLFLGVNEKDLPTIKYLEKLRSYSSRLNAVEILSEVRDRLNGLIGESYYFTNLDDLLIYLKSISGNKVLKMPLSGSGRGLIWILGEITDKQTDWCKRVIKKQGGVVAEPVYNKVADFALEFDFSSGKAEFAGYSLFRTTSSGAYSGNLLISDKVIEERLSFYVPGRQLHEVRKFVQQRLDRQFSDYNGFVGVDMMICEDDSDIYKLHPCVEINLRMNMGVISHIFYDRYIDAGSEGYFAVEYFKKESSALAFHEKMQREKPLKIDNGKIISGYLALTPVTSSTHYTSFVIVELMS